MKKDKLVGEWQEEEEILRFSLLSPFLLSERRSLDLCYCPTFVDEHSAVFFMDILEGSFHTLFDTAEVGHDGM